MPYLGWRYKAKARFHLQFGTPGRLVPPNERVGVAEIRQAGRGLSSFPTGRDYVDEIREK